MHPVTSPVAAPPGPPATTSISRRRFGQLSAALAAGGMLRVPAAAQSAAAPPTPASNPATDNVQWKLDRVLAEFGSRLDDAQKQRMRTIIAGHERMLAVITAFTLANGDPPATVLRVEVNDGQ